jgi:DNA-binding response OmpR family regulator
MSLMDPFAASKATILLFCSESDVPAILRGALEEAGYLVLSATGLDSAIEWLEDCKPALLIVRPYLEGISGHEAALFLRTKCNGLRVLMVAGLPEDDRVVYRESLSAVEVFPKPFAVAEFLEKVAAMLLPVVEDDGNPKASEPT